MNAIGIPLLHRGLEIKKRNDALLKAGALYDVPVYAYCIADIPQYIETGVLPAFCWEKGEYRRCEIGLPQFTEFYCDTTTIQKNFPQEFAWLTSNTVFTDGQCLGKTDFQQKLICSEYAQYAIPTFPVQTYQQIASKAALFPEIFLKPAAGRKAKGVMKVENRAGTLYCTTPQGSAIFTEEQYEQYISSVAESCHSGLLLEPCLSILNDDGRAVDFRCLVSLNGEGKWQNVLTYARIGGSDVASNFSHGGSLNFAEEVLEQLIPGQAEEKLKEINDVALEVAEFVRRESPNRVSWLGLDICLDRPSNQIYVIEANSKPGTKLVGPWPLALVRAQYFRYLLSQEE